jgi:hypothetical protein
MSCVEAMHVNTARIKTGFHRLGVVLGVIFLMPAVIAVACWPFASSGAGLLLLAVLAAAAAVASYLLARGLGWIAAGFLTDSAANSK